VTRLALLRHGHTPWNRAGRIQGRTDIPLDDAARAELAGLRLPRPWDRATLWSSPLKRAVDTAALVANRRPRTDAALTEMNWGIWEGLHGADLRADPTIGFRDIEAWGWDYCPPSGESPAAIRLRLEKWLVGLRGDNVAVCHIGIMRVLLAGATGWNFDGPAPFRIKRNRLFIIETHGRNWRMIPEPLRLEPAS
jgi:probable phosphoglycerate mutase